MKYTRMLSNVLYICIIVNERKTSIDTYMLNKLPHILSYLKIFYVHCPPIESYQKLEEIYYVF